MGGFQGIFQELFIFVLPELFAGRLLVTCRLESGELFQPLPRKHGKMPGLGEFVVGSPAGILQQLPDDLILYPAAILKLIGKSAPPLTDQPVDLHGRDSCFIDRRHVCIH